MFRFFFNLLQKPLINHKHQTVELKPKFYNLIFIIFEHFFPVLKNLMILDALSDAPLIYFLY